MQHLSKDGLICNFRADSFQGRAVTFCQLQNKFSISVLGLGKGSGVDVSMGKMADYKIKMLLFHVLGMENTANSQNFMFWGEILYSQPQNSFGVGSLTP